MRSSYSSSCSLLIPRSALCGTWPGIESTDRNLYLSEKVKTSLQSDDEALHVSVPLPCVDIRFGWLLDVCLRGNARRDATQIQLQRPVYACVSLRPLQIFNLLSLRPLPSPIFSTWDRFKSSISLACFLAWSSRLDVLMKLSFEQTGITHWCIWLMGGKLCEVEPCRVLDFFRRTICEMSLPYILFGSGWYKDPFIPSKHWKIGFRCMLLSRSMRYITALRAEPIQEAKRWIKIRSPGSHDINHPRNRTMYRNRKSIFSELKPIAKCPAKLSFNAVLKMLHSFL